ncbi:succinate dehydrogenase, cytochrome b556 subunit [Trichophyton rubrum D6]|uniref:Succinate dehydrogenase C subunit n=4 Tax=Trichophyton TaxID=5550 RepID=A0A178F2E3_TRIRU|nr:succinate dehydrogenase, cytochrome b556 subunit [Trichophyton rubrum CBS 118892]EZF22984.1 succinate dehydrogenase, cytochrome b556 subunit [Trichophyton rubrum MR850]EZF41809.1 succinate dehydrogenase, cytochrome b556 subunit [Trichophyton rubrum CBS 100081]EZF52457.1 succinate dehydrogenase, cytochrome b556 subunit [Trichophyton rubrum CBS 288.86]EZF63086.1 succinate dehydrogenase, cytochrome b556 subunit [Trichophyton rubrum CBS 289.86]EZF73669.1 succinate dehydrogenase, cytochrome b556
MFSNRLAQQSLRRLATQHPSAFRNSVSKFASPAAIAAGNYAQFRPATSSAAPSGTAEPNNILAKQRLNRPVSPHLSIYRPQITWYLSSLNRITGAILSGGLYIFASAYLVSPLLGWHLESASLAAAFAALPIAAKVAMKFTMALPFTFHCFNGVRHLVWDLGKQLTNQQVITTGWTVVGLTLTSALALALL